MAAERDGPAVAKAAAPAAGDGGTSVAEFALHLATVVVAAALSLLVFNAVAGPISDEAAGPNSPKAPSPPVSAPATRLGMRVFLPDDLAEFTGENGKPLYLAVTGEVFDVSKGSRFYGRESGSEYSWFAGKDGARSFVSGAFKDEEDVVAHDILDMTTEELLGVDHWRKFYRDSEDYGQVGWLHMPDGTGYFNADGTPNQRRMELEARLEAAYAEKERFEEEKVSYPGCNSRWEQGKGGELWCADAGLLPRQGRILPGAPERCACYTPAVAAQHTATLRVPAGCDAKATRCPIPE